MGTIRFFSEKIHFKIGQPRKTSSWIKDVIKKESCLLESLNIIFCTDKYLATMNVNYLGHNTYTDIITFSHSEIAGVIDGEIFISIPRVKENSSRFNTLFESELNRVIIHGVLHLIGYSDKLEAKKVEMRKKEDSYLSLRP